MPEKKKCNIELDKDTVQALEEVIDEIGDTTKSIFGKIGDLLIKKGRETLTAILDSNKVIIKEKIRSKEKVDEQKKES